MVLYKEAMTMSIQCIYCQEVKPTSAYKKVEHVIPQSFGKFRENLTLKHSVCDSCNQFFGDKIELILARDTLEGQSRPDFGIKKPEDFKSLGPESRIRIKNVEGEFKGAYAFLAYSKANQKIMLQPIPQVGFRRTDSGEIEYFLIDRIPDKKQLEKSGFILQGHKSIRLLGLGVEEASRKLAEKGIPFRYESDVVPAPSSESLLVERQATIDRTIFRATAKIAFNYLAYWEGSEFVRQSSFDRIRQFIRYGLEESFPLVRLSQNPILSDEGTRRRIGHLVTVAWATDVMSLVSQVSLLNLFTYSVCLARKYEGVQKNVVRGHFFNTYDGEIFELGINKSPSM